MKKVLFISVVAIAVTGLAMAGVVGSKHDLSVSGGTPASDATRVCVFCHTPHQAAAAAGQYPLWNHTLSAAGPYAAYSDPGGTIDADDLTDIPVAVAGSANTTHLCLSCHDGTVSVISMYNPPNEGTPTLVPVAGIIDGSGFIVSNANIGTTLANDHPVNFTYDNQTVTDDGELVAETDAAVAALLDADSKVQCASCHDVHDDTYPSFMVMDNTNSALCTTCHIK